MDNSVQDATLDVRLGLNLFELLPKYLQNVAWLTIKFRNYHWKFLHTLFFEQYRI